MKCFNFIICLIFISMFLDRAFGEDIVIYGNDSKPPKYFIENNQPKGILIDIMKYVDTKLQESFSYKLYPWKRAYSKALRGDGGIIGLSKNKERLEIFDYSDVMYYDTLLFVVIKGNEFTYNDVNDLKGKKIGCQRNASFGDNFEEAKKYLIFEEDNSNKTRLLKLLNKRIDVALIGPGKVGVDNVIKNDELLYKNRDKFIIIKKPFKNDPNYLGFAKKMKMKGFLKDFNKVLNEGIQSGEIQNILNKWTSCDKNQNSTN